eukprot:scaffold1969_cov130-Isochrysis_galbana.AAC.4
MRPGSWYQAGPLDAPDCNWYKILTRSMGAMQVRDIMPAEPPAMKYSLGLVFFGICPTRRAREATCSA